MSIEYNSPKFNIEFFKNNFKIILGKYISLINKHRNNEFCEEIDEKERSNIELDIIKYKNQLINLSINSLRESDNKQVILNVISEEFLHQNDLDNLESVYFIENKLLEGIIIELGISK